jgi:SAM-dependent methyltransferase
VIYQHPLAYLLGLEGLALLRAWAGDFDKEFVDRRLTEVRRLLADHALAGHPGVMVNRGDTLTAYRQWAARYDEPRNSLFDADEPVMHQIIDAFPPGQAVDAGCGTGRYAQYLAGHGHRVIGIDSSPEMLIREKTVRVADAMITRLQADLDCALAALERTKQESAFHASPAYASGVRISLRSLQDLSPRLLRHYRRTPGGTNVSAS